LITREQLEHALGRQLDQPGKRLGDLFVEQGVIERFTEEERVWLDAFRALDPEHRETILKVATVMRRPAPRKRGG